MLLSAAISVDAWLTVGVIGAMVLVMAFNLAGPDLVLIGGLTVLLAAGVIAPSQAFVGFSNPAVITIAVLFVVAAGIRQTGGLDYIGRGVLGKPRTIAGAQLRMIFPVATISAFLNNTPVVAMFVPLVQDWGRRNRISDSMLLMPLSYAAILGGTCTLIGTSTNLVVAGMALEHDPAIHFPMFEIALLGIPGLVIGTAFITLASRWLLKDRKGAVEQMHNVREYTIVMRVQRSSPVVGKTIEEAGLRALDNVYLYEVERDGHIHAAVSPNLRLKHNDRLHFTGVIDSMIDLRKMRLVPDNDQADKLRGNPDRRWVEAVISAQSSLEGRSVKESRFRTRYNAAILAVHRHGSRITQRKIGDIVLQAADVLLLEAAPSFTAKHQNDLDFALVSEVEDSAPPRYDRAGIALLILAAMVVGNVAGLIKLLPAALLAAAAMLVTRCITGSQARSAIQWQVIVAIAAAFGLSVALDKSGAAGVIATQLVDVALPLGRVPLLAAVYGLTALLAGVVSTTASAALMFPIAASIASRQGIPLEAMSYLIMLAASTAFSTPIGYQTNLMVYGPGGYRYTDFIRLGLPMQVLIGCSTIALITYVWL